VDYSGGVLKGVEVKIDLLLFLNIGLGLALAILNVKAIFVIPKKAPWRWVKMAYAVIGAIWFLLYFLLVLKVLDNSKDPMDFSAVIVRPMITFTLGILVASSIITLRRYAKRKEE
jgi:energy-coupling factor transporter transmembrane protein EcfT